ncbi:hypothetical protein BZA77DRAFT_389918 [Pyronema omphalodes]|nr:hypothetical protein BZA77DRAFT_389918 [Pyronema omphalodes]
MAEYVNSTKQRSPELNTTFIIVKLHAYEEMDARVQPENLNITTTGIHVSNPVQSTRGRPSAQLPEIPYIHRRTEISNLWHVAKIKKKVCISGYGHNKGFRTDKMGIPSRAKTLQCEDSDSEGEYHDVADLRISKAKTLV